MISRTCCCVLAAAVWLQEVRGVQAADWERRGNSFVFSFGAGRGELEWLSATSFRYRRVWDETSFRIRAPMRWEPVAVEVHERADCLDLVSAALQVAVAKETGLLRVRDLGGAVLLEEKGAEPEPGGRVVLAREVSPDERFRGLGVRGLLGTEPLDGRSISTRTPFLLSTRGYAEYFRAEGPCTFRFGRRREVEIPALEAEFFFHYGPSPKEVLEEHRVVGRRVRTMDWPDFELLQRVPEGSILIDGANSEPPPAEEILRCLLRASYSAILAPAVDLTMWRTGSAQLRRRLYALAPFMPVLLLRTRGLNAEEQGVARERKRWIPFLVSYAYEAKDRGFPLVRPLPMQYPRDGQAEREDQFLLGDELMIAPTWGAEPRRHVYFPMGQWTDFRTNRLYAGRRTDEVDCGDAAVCVFARNGSIVPLAERADGGLLEAHYFPRLAAEFFLYERGSGELTQLHAAPAGSWIRLEIEPAVQRTWEWVVHHVRDCRKVVQAGAEYGRVSARGQLGPGKWWQDSAKGNLHIQAQAPAGTTHVIYVDCDL